MSRHKLVKNLDLDEELSSYDGQEPEEEPIDPEDEGTCTTPFCSKLMANGCSTEAQLQHGTGEVYSLLSPDAAAKITQQQVRDALWHYYFDVDKSVAYLVKTFVEKPIIKKKVSSGRFCAISFCSVMWCCSMRV